ncbi:MAG TPA: response regulator transcription factor [Anaerolineae bacterium]
MSTRIVLADDNADVRSGIRLLLKVAPDLKIVGEAANGLDALRLVKELTPDVLLLDMEMPGLNGIEVTRHLQQQDSSVQVLALSGHDDKQYILGSLASGASGYLIKEEAPEIIVEAIRGVAHGEKGWVSRGVAAQIDDWVDGDDSE